MEDVKLTEEEQRDLEKFAVSVEQQKSALAELRLQYLRSEARVVQALAKTETEYLEHLKKLATEKGLDIEKEKWQYDVQGGVFKKQ